MAAAAPSSANGDDTFPKLLLRHAQTFAARPAIREKDLGIWQTWTWADVLDEVRAFALGLATLGVKRDDAIAIIGDNRPRLYWSMAAAQSLGAVPVPLYQDAVADEMAYVVDHADVKVAIAENQEQVDKLLQIRETVSGISHVIYDDPRGLDAYPAETVVSITALQDKGRARLADGTDAEADWLAGIASGVGTDKAVMLYTSGTTGKPKGVVLSFDNLVVSARNANAFDRLDEREEVLAYLPMAWVGDHVFSYAQSYTSGYCVACPESPDTVIDDRREIAPTYFFAPPRVYENLLTLITVRMEDASRVKRALFGFFMDVARRTGEKILDGAAVPLVDRVLYGLGDFIVYGPLKNRMGLSRLKVGYTAGEAIGPEIFRFYRSLGLNLKQLYGQTEASVYITMQPDGEIFADTVGVPAPGVELRIEPSGEVMYRSPGVFLDYYKNPDATAETKTPEGWVHTGDAGLIDEHGHLKIIDRAKDVGRLKDGTLFAPKYIENKLKFFPNIKEAVAVGHDRDYCAVMVNIDLVAVGNWAERNAVNYASYQELAADPRVYEMIESHVAQVNRDLAGEAPLAGSQIRRFCILHKELDADDGELTRTLKVRRTVIADRYASIIKALYDGSTAIDVATDVTFEDGRRGTIEGHLVIRDMESLPKPHALQEAAE